MEHTQFGLKGSIGLVIYISSKYQKFIRSYRSWLIIPQGHQENWSDPKNIFNFEQTNLFNKSPSNYSWL